MVKKYTISRDDSTYEAFPDMAANKKGDLICVFLECEHHTIRKNVQIAITKSADKGRTWSQKKCFAKINDIFHTYNCPRISLLSDGSMVIICDILSNDENGKIVEKDATKKAYQHIWRSYDDGQTWNGPETVNCNGIVPDKYQVLSNGRHIFGIHRTGSSGKLEQYAYISDDRGKTWNEVLIAADERYNLCEVSILEVKTGTLVAFMRENSLIGHACKKAISYDFGSTWEGVFDTNIDACHRPVTGFYKDNKILMTYRHYQGGVGNFGYPMQNLFGAFFDIKTALAKERKEHAVRIFPISYDRSPHADTGYSGWVYLENGEFYVVNYLLDDAPEAQIAGFSFDIDDVCI